MKNRLRYALRLSFSRTPCERKSTRRRITLRSDKPAKTLTVVSSLALSLALLLQGVVIVVPVSAQISVGGEDQGMVIPQQSAGRTYKPTQRKIVAAPSISVAVVAAQEALAPTSVGPNEIRAIHAPNARPHRPAGAVAIAHEVASLPRRRKRSSQLLLPSATGVSPAPSKTFKGEFLSGTTIPPDTMGAVGSTHILTVSNNQIRIQTRDGVQVTRMTLNAFWAGVSLEGGAAASTFDPKILFDRFNNRFIFTSSANALTLSSTMLLAVSQTSDPTGAWNRFVVDADPAANADGGIWIDYPSIGFNKNWIVVNENAFGYGTTGNGYQRSDVYVIDKQAAYANTLSSVSAFQGLFSTCQASSMQELELGCGFTMVPTVVEDDLSDTMFLIEDWDSTAAQLRISKLTGTPSAPILTVATQFPQSTNSWRFNASRIGTSGGYMPQRQQAAHLASGTRIMANDSRVQNAVLRNGSLWTTHHVMVAATPTEAGMSVGGAANPDVRSAVQWWEIDPTIENSLTGTVPIQRARIEDPLADNCHDGSAGTRTTGPCTSTLTQIGQFFSFPTISVNQNDDVVIGFSMMSPLTYPNCAYAFRASSDPINTTRDPVVFRPGQANYNIGAGASGTIARQNRWGDYSATQTDPLNDTDFWTIQEYAGTVRDFGIGLAGNWETWWSLVKPTGPTPVNSTSGLIISEFRIRGPQGVRDEFIELYNPSNSPIRVTTTDNSEGWTIASNNGVTTSALAVVPVGTVIPARGHFLIADNPDGATGPSLVYGLNGYPSVTAPGTPPGFVRGADSDTGYSVDISDVSGIALFNTTTVPSFSASTVLDAAGPTTLPAGSIFREGAGYAVLPTTNLQYSMHRNQVSGTPADTGNNAADFLFSDVASTSTTAGQRLGAPGPENLDGPRPNLNVFVDRFDMSVGTATAPNRFRDLTPVTNGTLGTLSFRRRVQNLTGQPATVLRFRIKDITTSPASAGIADLRALTSGDITVNGFPVKGTLLEEPPAQVLGGGWNASWSVALPVPLPHAATVDVQYVVGVMQGGSFRIFISVEALP